ncbi:DUF3644 domain-containing protein [Nocardioides massiliensis]|uniref:DUF3644 domain-containing protein n=1 Tax=Nocardioides massiliensis TaxID=1325935 RepID=A0ABT9NIT9_9ACTN|nr:DUF3644 domain-containing protein [Nocardioides massiliensis]MDP9820333.1 hypothetical protein [Nocardioides massiliensis]
MRVTARKLHGKALSSMRTAMTAFNSPHDDGRATVVLLHLQHSFEMLLKAALYQRGAKVFDKKTGRSISFDAAINQARQLAGLKVTEDEAGTLRAVDALRDDEQHWFNDVSEGLLYLHARAAVTLFDELLYRAFKQRLADHLPNRVLPVSTEAPQDLLTLVDSEYANIAELLKPGRRARGEARAKIRTLLALEAHVAEDTKVSDSDVDRVENGIKAGKSRQQVFPKLTPLAADISGEGLTVKVKIVKHADALPVRLVREGEDDAEMDAAAVREVDLQKKYHWPARDLAEKLRISAPRAAALREHLGIDDDPQCVHVFEFGSQKHSRYSDNALARMRDAVSSQNMDAIWESHGAGRRTKPRPPCTQSQCARTQRQEVS